MESMIPDIVADLPEFESRIRELRETLLANLVMLSEIPAPTFEETERVEFLLEKFTESNLMNTSTDETGNALGLLPGTEGDSNILLVSHLDTLFSEKIDHSVSVESDRITGAGIGHNAVGLATLTVLPVVLDKLNIKLKSNLILMGSARSLGKGSIGGIRFFLSNTKYPIKAGICVDGVKLGKISHSSTGMMRFEIIYNLPPDYDWKRFGTIGAIPTLSEIVTQMQKIPIPNKPRTTIILGSMECGTAFNTIPTEGILRFEIRSESEEMVNDLKYKIQNIVAEVSSIYGIDIAVNIIAQRKPGGIPFSHPLTNCARGMLKHIGIKSWIQPDTSELSAFSDNNIPAITIGMTEGRRKDKIHEYVEISPLSKGLAQLVGLIVSIDRGRCDES